MDVATLGPLGGFAAFVGRLDGDFFGVGDGASTEGDSADGNADAELSGAEVAGPDELRGTALLPSAEHAARMPPPPVRAASPATLSTLRRLVPARP